MVTTISSPAFNSRPIARASANVMVVMFCPNTTSFAWQLKKSAIAWRVDRIIASFRRLVSKAPQVLAFALAK